MKITFEYRVSKMSICLFPTVFVVRFAEGRYILAVRFVNVHLFLILNKTARKPE